MTNQERRKVNEKELEVVAGGVKRTDYETLVSDGVELGILSNTLSRLSYDNKTLEVSIDYIQARERSNFRERRI